MTPDHEERIERLERALLELVRYHSGRVYQGWYTVVLDGYNVDDIIGDLLDKYEPTKEVE